MKLFLSRLVCFEIIRDHYNTFYNDQSQSKSWGEILILLILVIIFSIICTIINCLNMKTIELMLTAISILSGFLISALFLLVDKTSHQSGKDFQIITETMHNISFGILIGLYIIVFSFIALLAKNSSLNAILSIQSPIYIFASFIYFFLVFLFFHTIFMIIQRINKIFIEIL